MNTLDGDALRRGAGGGGQSSAPGEMGVVHQSRPVDRADNDRIARTEEDEANGFERIVDCDGGFDPSPQQRVPERRCDIEAKGSDEEARGNGRSGIYGLRFMLSAGVGTTRNFRRVPRYGRGSGRNWDRNPFSGLESTTPERQ